MERMSCADLHAIQARGGGAMRQMQARGRLAPGEMNRTEARFDAEYLGPRRLVGEIVWSRFECIKLQVAPGCWLTPDFPALAADGVLEFYDVKGARAIYADDAKVKMKVVAAEYPFRIFVAFPRRGGGWDVEQVGGPCRTR